jgi:hypothetical protein
MYNVTRVVHFDDNADSSDRAEYIEKTRLAVKDLRTPCHLVSPTLPGVINGGELLVHLQLPVTDGAAEVVGTLDDALDAAGVSRIDGVQYHPSPGQSRAGVPRSVYRALLLRVAPGTTEATVERFEQDLLRMPRYIPSIGAWRLNRVEKSVGPVEWTHVWEQEFTDRASLMGQYLEHPIHWSVVDRWFDPECPEAVVLDRVCHTFCAIGDNVIR